MSNDKFHPYKDRHVTLDGPGDQRPTGLEIVKDEDLVGKLSNRTVLITGAASGIGVETARAMHETGAKVVIAVRDTKKGQEVIDEILKTSDINAEMDVIAIDLGSLESVRDAAKEFLAKYSELNILILNAGTMAIPERTLTKDGHETQWAVNHLGHFLLFQLLKPILLKSASAEFESRVVAVSSSGHRTQPVNFGDLNFDQGYDPWKAYGSAKTGQTWMANEIFRRYGAQHLTANSLNPGGITTPLQRYIPQEQKDYWAANPEIVKQMKSTAQGAATTVWAAIGQVWKGQGGKYLEDVSVAPVVVEGTIGATAGAAPWWSDPENEKKSWKVSCEIVGVEND